MIISGFISRKQFHSQGAGMSAHTHTLTHTYALTRAKHTYGQHVPSLLKINFSMHRDLLFCKILF